MTTTFTKTIVAGLTALTLVGSVGAANAFPRGWGGFAVGAVVGTAAGAMIASSAQAAPRCWNERQIVDTDYGPRRVWVRVCG